METTARAAGADEDLVRNVSRMVHGELEKIWDPERSPPEISAPLYYATGRMCGSEDPFLAKKIRYTREALKCLPIMDSMIRDADDPFDLAVRVSIAGNIIDFGTGENRDDLNVAGILGEFAEKPMRVDDTQVLFQAVSEAGKVLFIGDNAGETVFDRPLLSILRQTGDLYYAVRDVPIINDTTVRDAVLAGVGLHAEIVSSGSRLPGTVLERCSGQFQKLFSETDLIIAKGQGNFETLTELPRDGRIFMLFIIKCTVAARQVSGNVGDMVVMRW